MKTITKREMTRKPSVLNNLAPGESAHISDRKGGLLITRPKSNRLTPEEMRGQLDQLAAYCPPLDVDKVLLHDD